MKFLCLGEGTSCCEYSELPGAFLSLLGVNKPRKFERDCDASKSASAMAREDETACIVVEFATCWIRLSSVFRST